MTEQFKKLSEGILYTDHYQLTMAQVYYRLGLWDKTVQFDHFFRSYPDYGSHQAGYCITAGWGWLADWMATVRTTENDLDALRQQRSSAGEPVFSEDFLRWLKSEGHFGGLTIRGIPEGRVVHRQVPLTVVNGPLGQAQLLETALLNQLNYQTLIATKASRIREAAHRAPVLEFGVRRGHDRGAHAGTRAALIGGADFSSNCGTSLALGYPPKGTHAHSLIQLFLAMGEGELAAFQAYAENYPDDTVLLLDTVNTLESGLPNAIKVFEGLRRRGHRPRGVRLDSGDLAHLAVQVSHELDQAGFPEVSIVLSNDLDELAILQITAQVADEADALGIDADRVVAKLVYGVGTKLITSWGDAALGGVYKLVSVLKEGAWVPAIKLSESGLKVPNPGHKQAWRLYENGRATADMLSLKEEIFEPEQSLTLHSAVEDQVSREVQLGSQTYLEPLHEELYRSGKRLDEASTIEELRKRRDADLESLHSGVRRLINPHIYHVSLSSELKSLKETLIRAMA